MGFCDDETVSTMPPHANHLGTLLRLGGQGGDLYVGSTCGFIEETEGDYTHLGYACWCGGRCEGRWGWGRGLLIVVCLRGHPAHLPTGHTQKTQSERRGRQVWQVWRDVNKRSTACDIPSFVLATTIVTRFAFTLGKQCQWIHLKSMSLRTLSIK